MTDHNPAQMPISDLLEQALAYHQAGHLGKAQALYNQILQMQTDHADALHLKALVLDARGESEQAIECIQQAIACDSNMPAYHNNLGTLFEAQGMLDKARACYEKAIQLDVQYPDALSNLASVLLKTHDLSQACQVLQSAIAIDSSHRQANCLLAQVYQAQNRRIDAIARYQNILQYEPDNVTALVNLGNLYQQERQYIEAIACYERVLSHNNNHALANYNLGLTYKLMNICTKARDYLTRARKLMPDNVKTLLNLGQVYQLLGDNEQAYECFEAAATHHAHDPEALAWYAYGQLLTARWQHLDSTRTVLKQAIEARLQAGRTLGVLPLIARHLFADNALLHAIAKDHCQRVIQGGQSFARFTHSPRKRGGRLKIAYVSPDFNKHPLGLLLGDLFAYHDRKRFEIYAYDLSHCIDDYHQIIKQHCDHMVDISCLPAKEAAQRIFSDGIDILIDLAGETGFARPQIFAYKPAPIQCHCWGDNGTLGADYFDYYITTQTEVPDEVAVHFTEDIIYLPQTSFATSGFTLPDKLPTRQDYQLPEQAIIYCCFNAIQRFDPAFFSSVLAILKRVPDAVFWMQADNPALMARLKGFAHDQGVDPKRIIITPARYMTQHWHHSLADIALDTFTISGGTSAILSVWIGLPVVTCAGRTPSSRFGAAIAKAALNEACIAQSPQAYIDTAVALGCDRTRLRALRARLRDERANMSLFQAKHFIADLEMAYQNIWLDCRKKNI